MLIMLKKEYSWKEHSQKLQKYSKNILLKVFHLPRTCGCHGPKGTQNRTKGRQCHSQVPRPTRQQLVVHGADMDGEDGESNKFTSTPPKSGGQSQSPIFAFKLFFCFSRDYTILVYISYPLFMDYAFSFNERLCFFSHVLICTTDII